MRGMAKTDSIQVEYGTINQAARRFGTGAKRLRTLAAAGAFPMYDLGTAWPRVKFSEVETWLRSTRVPATDHAAKRVDEILEREGAA